MKILLCTNQYDTISNGPARFAHLITAFGNQDIRILSEDIADESVILFRIDMPNWIRRSFFSQFFRMILYHRRAMEIRADFHFDYLVYNHALVGLWSAIWFKKTVGMFNDDNYASFRSSSVPFSWIWVKKWLFRQVERAMYRICDKVVVNSEYQKKKLIDEYGIRKNIFRLYKGIPLPKNIKLKIQSTDTVEILFIKKDYKTGGLSDLIQALQLVSFQFKLHIVGPDPIESPELYNWTNKAGIVGITTFHGNKKPEEITELMKRSSILCVPSRREALGTANIEALAYGLPVVSTSVGGIPEVLDQGRNGWMSPPQNPQQLAKTLDECVTQPLLRMQKTICGLDYVKRFSASGMYNEFLRIFQ